MKKISSVMLAVLILVMSFAAVPASAEFTADDITVSVNVYDISVTVMSETSGVMTAKLTSSDGATLYGMKSDRVPVEVAVGSNTEYKYEFSFRMRDNVATGTYAVKVGNNVTPTQKTFPYVRLGDKIDFYTTLDTKTAGTIKQYFADNSSMVPVDLTTYNGLNELTILPKVDAAIEDLNLNPGIASGDTDSQKVDKVSAIDTLFTTAFADLMEIAEIASVTEADWNALADSKVGTTFDAYFYDVATAGTAALDKYDVYENFATEAALVTDFTLAAYADAFDKATLMQIKETRSFGVLKDAFVYFEGTGSIAPDMTNIQALIDAGKDTDLWKALSESSVANADELVALAETTAFGMVEDGVLTDTPDDEVGGSSTPIDTPTGGGGGGSLGGGGATGGGAPSTPATPVTPVDPEPEVPTGAFTDIASVEWASEAIEALAQKGILNGKGDGKFYPGDTVTREEFVKIIISAFDLLDENAKADFVDVDVERWSYAYIAAANELGIVTGDGDSFNPAGRMTRQDMAVVIYRTAEKLGIELSGEAIEFTDSADISDYAKEAVSALSASGVINGMGDGTFAPEFTVTRAQAAKVIYGLLNLVGGGK